MFAMTVKIVDINPLYPGICSDMGDYIILFCPGQKGCAVFGSPHAVEPVFYVRHGFKFLLVLFVLLYCIFIILKSNVLNMMEDKVLAILQQSSFTSDNKAS